ncbi:MAG: tetratricopeptide repeat protein [Gammaproteobacteria bacterium]|nr:tetratricopeptide repeat protein [Gammaproteobacteria bacterium]
MSVINSVLKDLESRPSQFTPIEITPVGGAPPGGKGSSKWPFALALVVTVVAVLGITYYQVQSQPPVIETVEPVTAPQPNQMIGLQIRESTTQLSLEFELHEKTVSYLKERSQNSFIYHLKDIKSQIEAPVISDNRWIERLSISQQETGVDVTFKTTNRVLVNTEQMQKQSEAIWIIRLEKLPDPVIETSKLDRVEPAPVFEEEKIGSVKVAIKTSISALNETNQLQQAREFIKKRDWQTAETLLLGLIDGPQDMPAREQLLGLYAQPQFTKKYSKLALQSNARYPQNSLFAVEYARALFQQQEYESAIALLQSLPASDAKQLALIAASYQRLDQHENAIDFYRQSLKLNRQQAKSWIGLGISLEHNAQIEAALKSYQAATKLGNLNQRLIEFAEQRSQALRRVLN